MGPANANANARPMLSLFVILIAITAPSLSWQNGPSWTKQAIMKCQAKLKKADFCREFAAQNVEMAKSNGQNKSKGLRSNSNHSSINVDGLTCNVGGEIRSQK